MFIGFEQVVATNVVKDVNDLTVVGNATHVEIQADTADINYTMDNAISPTTTSGMTLRTSAPPKSVLIEDLRRIKFIRSGGANGNLNIHYFTGGNV